LSGGGEGNNLKNPCFLSDKEKEEEMESRSGRFQSLKTCHGLAEVGFIERIEIAPGQC
jgi:hypothetical protein